MPRDSRLTTNDSLARILIIAGSDSGGGAGIQGDLKTVAALGGYGMTAITALTAQNTLGVSDIYPVPPHFVAEQIRMCLDDIGADAIKTGMLHSAEVIAAVAETVMRYESLVVSGSLATNDSRLATPCPLIVDPVMLAKGGASLLAEEALEALKTLLIPRATIITPNLPEAEWLLGRAIAPGDEAMREAAEALLALGARAVLLKGGHAQAADGSPPAMLTDILVQRDAPPLILTAPRLHTRHTHGTGCAFASAIATGLGQGLPLADAVARAHAYVQAAIARAPGLGQGHGPLGHSTCHEAEVIYTDLQSTC